MSVKLKIKLVYDFDENEYVTFIQGLPYIEGRGLTEEEAIENFKINYEKELHNEQ